MLDRHLCDIWRNAPVGTTRYERALLTSGVLCTFIPMTGQASLRNGFDVGKGYDVFFSPDIDVQVGDQLKRDGDSYVVRAVAPYRGFGVIDHLAVMADLEVH